MWRFQGSDSEQSRVPCSLGLTYLPCSVLSSDNGLSLQSCSSGETLDKLPALSATSRGLSSLTQWENLANEMAFPIRMHIFAGLRAGIPNWTWVRLGNPHGHFSKTNINTDTKTHIHHMPFYWTPECLVQSSQEQLWVQSSLSSFQVPAGRQAVPPCLAPKSGIMPLL